MAGVSAGEWRGSVNWLAALKTLLCKFTTLIEFCHRCGVRQPVVWWCESDEVWKQVTGCDGNGIYCPTCFDKMAAEKGISIRFIATADSPEPVAFPTEFAKDVTAIYQRKEKAQESAYREFGAVAHTTDLGKSL